MTSEKRQKLTLYVVLATLVLSVINLILAFL